ncbi:hypothetical protein EG328_008587 [Venturia inaequalis]|uniref:Uncharacterized protein n=1 Tax=Venturia inaequalis TaxID=5025 RepID=A0A8H3UCN1_VENIN|nr:hypothetical protein EG328_008587 [Venturia inaequalis]
MSPALTSFLVVLMLIVCPLLFAHVAQACTPNCGQPSSDGPLRPVMGIDLGTTYSVVGVMKEGKLHIVPNDQGNSITPSYVALTDRGSLVGDLAKSAAALDPKNTIFDIKRLIGREFSDENVQSLIPDFPFQVVEQAGRPAVKIGKQLLTPEEISASILLKMKDMAENYIGEHIDDAVITVPAYFNDAQRTATRDAAAIAGLNVLRLVNEPTAASLAYGLGRNDDYDQERNVLVFDLGGGTFDVSILVIDEGVFEVMSTAGNTNLGGEAFDQRVMDHVLTNFQKATGATISKSSPGMSKLKSEVERVKKVLSSETSATIDVQEFQKGKLLSETLTRAKFEALNKDLFLQTLEPVKQALKDAKMKISDIDDIVLVGGSTRIPYVRKMLHDYFGKSPMTNINPDEAVAMGAIIQGCIIMDCPGVQSVLMMDVNPLTLGIETDGGIMAPLIKRGTGIPTNRRQVFSTTVDNQETVRIRVFEGEQHSTKDNNELGEFLLSGIPAAPKGVPQIEVEFEVDSNGILQVHAAEHGAGISASVTIKDSGLLSADEMERMIDTAAAQKYVKTGTSVPSESAQDKETYGGSIKWEHGEL